MEGNQMPKDDAATAVAAAQTIVTSVEHRLNAARGALATISRTRRTLAFKALGLDDTDAARKLASEVREETGAREHLRNAELAHEEARIALATARERELAERKPRYRAGYGRPHVAVG